MVKYHHAFRIIYYIYRAKKSPIHEYFVLSKINVLNYKCEPYSSSDLPDPGSPSKKKRKSLSRKSVMSSLPCQSEELEPSSLQRS